MISKPTKESAAKLPRRTRARKTPSAASESRAAYGELVKKAHADSGENMTAPKRMTEEAFVAWYEKADETVRAEWVAGEVVVHMPDNIEHEHRIVFLENIERVCDCEKTRQSIFLKNTSPTLFHAQPP